jgi:hypothetical protein
VGSPDLPLGSVVRFLPRQWNGIVDDHHLNRRAVAATFLNNLGARHLAAEFCRTGKVGGQQKLDDAGFGIVEWSRLDRLHAGDYVTEIARSLRAGGDVNRVEWVIASVRPSDRRDTP